MTRWRWALIAFAAVACAPHASSQQPTKRALLVGINKYKYAGTNGVSNLAGCVNDAQNMRALLVGKFDFPDDPDHILILRDDLATHAGIVGAIEQHLIAKTAPGDVVVIYFAGHGSQMKDTSGTRINGMDETIVPHDSRDPRGKVFDISGNELDGLVGRLSAKTDNVTLVLDSCHSGTMLQDPGIRSRSVLTGVPRFIPPDTRQPPAPPSGTTTATRGAGLRPPGAKWAFIGGARADELSNEYDQGGRREGAMTHMLVDTLRTAAAGATYRDVMDRVVTRVSEMFPSQHPQLEGVGADTVLFGDQTSLAAPFVIAQPITSGAELRAGASLGVTKDSVFEVYAPGEKTFPPGNGTAKVRVTDVHPDSSTAIRQSGGTIARDSRAVERERKFVTPQMRLAIVDDAAAPELGNIRNRLKQYRQVECVRDLAKADLALAKVNGNLEIRGLGSVEPLFTVAAAKPDAASAVVETALLWAQWFNLRGLANPVSALHVKLDMTVDGAPMPVPSRIKEGQKVAFTLVNQSFVDLFVVLFDFSTDGSRTAIYPSAGGQQKLNAGQTYSLPASGVFVSAGRTEVTDTIKLFATTTQVDFQTMTAAAIPTSRGIGALQELFWAAAQGQTRNVNAPVSLGEWTTAERMFTVVK